ncbi:unnamed protein product [Rotaria sp. Silwood2]|nr:unnamed protein product [Rotaria sp. Silwood2]
MNNYDLFLGSYSNTGEWNNLNNQRIYSDLAGTIHKFSSIKDHNVITKRFQSPLDISDQDQLLLEGYRLVNSQDAVSSFQIATHDAGSTDGSGMSTEDDSTSVAVTDTTDSTTTIHLTSNDFQTSALSTHISETTSERSQTSLFISTLQSDSSPSTILPIQSSNSISITTEQITNATSSSTTTTPIPLDHTQFYLDFRFKGQPKNVDTSPPEPSISQEQILSILIEMNNAYDTTNVQISNITYLPNIIIQYSVMLNISLNIMERLYFVIQAFETNISSNPNYGLTVRAIINTVANHEGKFNAKTIKETKQSTNTRQFTIPRAYLPTMGTTSQGAIGFTDLSHNANHTYPSNSTTIYNPIYRTNEDSQHTSLSSSSIPQTQMLGIADTLNSFPRDLIHNPSGTTSLVSDSNDIDEIEFTTDMLHDMIKDDDNMEDDFIEAINPNVIIPRSIT